MPASVDRVSHLHLVVTDVARSVRFYTNAFGFELRYTSAAGVVFLRNPANDSLALEQATSARAPGLDHFGFALDDHADINIVVDEVVAGGGSVLERRESVPGHPHVTVTDPDGHVIML